MWNDEQRLNDDDDIDGSIEKLEFTIDQVVTMGVNVHEKDEGQHEAKEEEDAKAAYEKLSDAEKAEHDKKVEEEAEGGF